MMKEEILDKRGTTMKHYSVDFKISGFKSIQVEAKNIEEATKKAEKIINEVDFGELEEIDTKVSDVDFDMNYDDWKDEIEIEEER